MQRSSLMRCLRRKRSASNLIPRPSLSTSRAPARNITVTDVAISREARSRCRSRKRRGGLCRAWCADRRHRSSGYAVCWRRRFMKISCPVSSRSSSALGRLTTFAHIIVLATIVAWPSIGFAQGVRWFLFNRAFILAHYAPDSAIGSVLAQRWAAAKSIHQRSCGGKDGELHIGSLDYELDEP